MTRTKPPQFVSAVLRCVWGDIVVLDAGESSGIHPADRLRVKRVLERVPDPCDPSGRAALGFLVAVVGEAEVLEVGRHASLARYAGRRHPRAGDLAMPI